MPPHAPRPAPSGAAAVAVNRVAADAGRAIHERRRARRWSLRELGRRSGLTGAAIQRLEAGRPGSLDSYARIGVALGLRPELQLVDPRRPVAAAARQADAVHAWMGDVEASRLQRFGFPVAIDEPYQHYQFAGRGDLVAWSLPNRTLLHIENRTRFPDLQEAIGAYNAKCAYLADSVAKRLGLHDPFRSVTHVLALLWSAELRHVVRLRSATFRAVCPAETDAFAGWWQGVPPPEGVSRSLVFLDPLDRGRARRWVDLSTALRSEARYRDYLDAVRAIPGHE